MTQNGPKMTFWYLGDLPGTKNDPKWGKNDPKWPYMAPNDLKRTKNDSKSPKNDILISGGTTPGPKSQKNCSPLSSIFDVEAPFQRYLPKSEILAPKEVTKHSGKRSIGLPGIVSFLHVGKGSQGHVLDRSGPIWPTWNTPKKCFLSRKRPKEDEKVGWGHFHERVNGSPIRCGHFGANGSKISRFVSEIRPFKEKVLV